MRKTKAHEFALRRSAAASWTAAWSRRIVRPVDGRTRSTASSDWSALQHPKKSPHGAGDSNSQEERVRGEAAVEGTFGGVERREGCGRAPLGVFNSHEKFRLRHRAVADVAPGPLPRPALRAEASRRARRSSQSIRLSAARA